MFAGRWQLSVAGGLTYDLVVRSIDGKIVAREKLALPFRKPIPTTKRAPESKPAAEKKPVTK
ncbi:MAG: hypothetical protein SVV80_00205 [Planctomycetota bacterium]|nr:hypothetical protein [Planctomycetota bacterium]